MDVHISQIIDFVYSLAAAPKLPITAVPSGDHGTKPEQLASMTREHNFSALQNYGGASLSLLITSAGFVMNQDAAQTLFLCIVCSGFKCSLYLD